LEGASIKPHNGVITLSMDPSIRGRRVTGTASPLLDLITTAYKVRYNEISGAPGWAHDDHYDLEAKPEVTTDEMRRMLQTLLADRFQLKVHRGTQEVPIYALVVAKNGPKLKTVPADATGGDAPWRPRLEHSGTSKSGGIRRFAGQRRIPSSVGGSQGRDCSLTLVFARIVGAASIRAADATIDLLPAAMMSVIQGWSRRLCK
jgi:uncharacterized protein (TIGR03435 family)